MTDIIDQTETRGFVYAATGERYVILARRAARSLRMIHPDAEIDLFTDTNLEDSVFSQIHKLSESWFRPKMEALWRSRFDRTILLDADTMTIAPLDPVFEVLDRFDIAACHNRLLNSDFVHHLHLRPLPDAFATLNAGVIGLRKSDATQAFLREWQQAVKETKAERDQPALRELLYDSDLRVWVLPPGYNLMTFHELRSWWGMFNAPRVLHSPLLRKRREGPGNPEKPYTLAEMVGIVGSARVRALLYADRSLTPDVDDATRNMYHPLEPALLRWLRNRAKPIYRKLRYKYRQN